MSCEDIKELDLTRMTYEKIIEKYSNESEFSRLISLSPDKKDFIDNVVSNLSFETKDIAQIIKNHLILGMFLKFVSENPPVADYPNNYYMCFYKYDGDGTYDHTIILYLTEHEMYISKLKNMVISIASGQGNDEMETKVTFCDSIEISFDVYNNYKNKVNSIGYSQDLYKKIIDKTKKIYVIGNKYSYNETKNKFLNCIYPIQFEDSLQKDYKGIIGVAKFKFVAIDIEIIYCDSDKSDMTYLTNEYVLYNYPNKFSRDGYKYIYYTNEHLYNKICKIIICEASCY